MATKKTSVKVDRPNNKKDQSFLDKIQTDLTDNQSYLNLILGALILVVLGVLVYNYFNKPADQLGPAQQTQQTQTGDVAKENLPGKYTIKEGDTLFSIAKNYYDDGYKYPELVKANSLANENAIEIGQVLEIPKQGEAVAQASTQPSQSPSMSPETAPSSTPANEDNGTGGAENQTIWGEKITGDTYTVASDDWLTKIAGRAYGDINQFDKIAKANNITDPNVIEVGTVLKLPR